MKQRNLCGGLGAALTSWADMVQTDTASGTHVSLRCCQVGGEQFEMRIAIAGQVRAHVALDAALAKLELLCPCIDVEVAGQLSAPIAQEPSKDAQITAHLAKPANSAPQNRVSVFTLITRCACTNEAGEH